MRSILTKLIIVGVAALSGVLIFQSYVNLSGEVQSRKDPIVALPKGSAVIIESSSFMGQWKRLSETNMVWSELKRIPSLGILDEGINVLDSIFHETEGLESIFNSKRVALGFSLGTDQSGFLAALALSEDQFRHIESTLLSGELKKEEINGVSVLELSWGGDSYHFCYQMPFAFLSSNSALIEQSLMQIEDQVSLLNNSEFVDIRNTVRANASANIYVQSDALSPSVAKYMTKEFSEAFNAGEIVPEWMEFDLTQKSEAIMLNGLSLVLKQQSLMAPQRTTLLDLIPENVSSFERKVVSEGNYGVSEEVSIDALSEKCNCHFDEYLASLLADEVLSFDFGRNGEHSVSIFECQSGVNYLGKWSQLGVNDSIIDSISGVPFYVLDRTDILGSLSNIEEGMVYAQVNEYAVFSSVRGLSGLLYHWKKMADPLRKKFEFEEYRSDYMAEYSSYDLYSSLDKFGALVRENVRNEHLTNFDRFMNQLDGVGKLVWQGVPSNDKYSYNSLALGVGSSGERSTSQLWQYQIDTTISRKPELMKNHRTKTSEVLVQDDSKKLHLIGANGKLKWSRQLAGSIVGRVNQIDAYKNNKWQMLFNTSTHIYLVDINGKDVKGFPKKLPSKATAGLSVFDYDGKKEYRVLIPTEDRKILNYSQMGSSVKGWDFKKSASAIRTEIHHFKAGGKDVLLAVDESGKVYVLDRKGNQRVKVNSAVSDNYYIKKGKSISSSRLVYVDTSKVINETWLSDSTNSVGLQSLVSPDEVVLEDLDGDHLLDYVVVKDNKLFVYGPNRQLIQSQSFDYELLGITDLLVDVNGLGHIVAYHPVLKELHLFNRKLEEYPDYPVSGGVLNCIGDMNKDGELNLITIDENSVIKVYSVSDLQSL